MSAHATGDYVLAIDADSRVANPTEARDLLTAFAAHYDGAVVGTVEVRSAMGPGPDASVAVASLQRFFQRDRFRYVGAIHEQLAPVDGRDHRVAATGVRYLHTGYAHDPATARRKTARNLRLLAKELAQRPDDEYYLYQLGKAHFSLDEYAAAAEAFERALGAVRLDPGQAPAGRTGRGVAAEMLADLVVSLAYAYVNTARLEQAHTLLAAHEALGHAGTQGADFPHAVGYVHLMRGDVPRAKTAYAEALARGPAREQVVGTGSFSSSYHLGLLSEADQDLEGAMAHYLRSIRAKPDYRVALTRCVDLVPEYRVSLPPELWDAVDREVFQTVYLDRLRHYVEHGARDQAKGLIDAAYALAAPLGDACTAVLEPTDRNGENDVPGE